MSMTVVTLSASYGAGGSHVGPRLAEAGCSPVALVDDLAALGFEPARLVSGRAVRVARTDIDLDTAHERDRLFVHRTA